MAEYPMLKVYIPKGEHLGKPLNQFVEGKANKWSGFFSGQSEPIRFMEDRKRGLLLPVAYRPKELGNQLPDADFVITTKDKIADLLSERNSLNIHSDKEVASYLAKEGFRVMRGLEYNPCLIGAATSNSGDWRAIDPMEVFTGHPFMVYRDCEREHGPDGPTTDVTIMFRGQRLYDASIGAAKNGAQPRKTTINYILGGEESYANGEPNRVIIPVIQTGNSIIDANKLLEKMAKLPLRIAEFMYFSEPVMLVRQETAEQYPHLVARIDHMTENVIRRGKRSYPSLFEPPSVIAAYPREAEAFVNKHYPVGTPERPELLRRLDLPADLSASKAQVTGYAQ